MSDNRPSQKEFTQRVEADFGRPLNQKAVVAAHDIYRRWDDIRAGLNSRTLTLHLNAHRFLIRHPDHGSRAMEWGSLLVCAVGLGLFFVYWLDGVLALGLGAAGFASAKRLRVRHVEEHRHDLVWKITGAEAVAGLVQMAALYIAGILEMRSDKGSAHWPEYPSGVFTGEKTYIPY